MRRLLCAIGAHSTFVQHDRWGAARVCRFCDWNKPESCDRHTHSTLVPCTRGNSLEEYLRKCDARRGEG